MVGPYFLGMSLFPCVPSAFLLCTRGAPTSPPVACCLPGWACSRPLPTTGLCPACCRGLSWAPAPPHLHLSPPSSHFSGMACNSSLPEPQPLYTKYIPLICLLVELKGQISTKIPAVGLGRKPQAKTGHPSRGVEGAQLTPPHQDAPRAGVWLPQKLVLHLLQTPGRARAQAVLRRKNCLKQVSSRVSLSSFFPLPGCSPTPGIVSWPLHFLP